MSFPACRMGPADASRWHCPVRRRVGSTCYGDANGTALAGRPLDCEEASTQRALRIAAYFRDHLHTGFATALHILMDIGLPVVKPDTCMIRLFSALGLTGELEVPSRISMTDALCTDVVRAAAAVTVEYRDMAWNASNPLRELDIVMVKFVQAAGRTEGIEAPIETDPSCPVARRWLREELSREH